MWIISELFIWFNKKQLSATKTHQLLLPSNRRLHLSSPSSVPPFAPTLEINQHDTFARLLTYGSCAFRRLPRPQHGMKGTRAVGGRRGTGGEGRPSHRLPSSFSPAPWLRSERLSGLPSSATTFAHNPQKKGRKKLKSSSLLPSHPLLIFRLLQQHPEPDCSPPPTSPPQISCRSNRPSELPSPL